MSVITKKSFLYNFLISSRCRIWRHLLLITIGIVMSVNQMLNLFQQNIGALHNEIYGIFLFLLINYGFTVYFNLYVLVPNFLLKKKYTKYLLALSATILILTLSGTLIEYLTYSSMDLPNERTSYFNLVALLDLISNFTMYILCIVGISVTILLKNWMQESERINELEKIHIQSEVQRLKEQANPQFLSNILNRAGSLTQTEPKNASDMLYKLSQLLRYQLYDCSRDKVLLTSEINYLTNYLSLEKQYSGNLQFKIESKGNTNCVFVAPLLFIPFVHEAVEAAYKKENANKMLYLHFIWEGEILSFVIQTEAIEKNIGDSFSDIKHRLDILYPESYNLTIADGSIHLQLTDYQSLTSNSATLR